MEIVHACNVCGSTANEKVFAVEDHYSTEKFWLTRCQHCSCVYTNPRPTNLELSHYYPPAYYGTNGQRFQGGLEKIVHLFRQRLADKICRSYPKPGRVLEVGSGRGTLLAELARRGWQAVGTEFSASLAQASFDNLGVQVFPTPDLQQCQFESDLFDIVICYHVLEHLPNPKETLAEIRRILRADGLLIIAVPNFGGLIARFSQENWFALDVPRHLHHFTPTTLTAVLDGTGFEVDQSGTLSLEQDIFGFAQSCLNMAGLPFNILYDLIRSRSARLRHQTSPTSFLVHLKNLAIIIMGGGLSLVGLPIVTLAALIGQGGTLEYWARPKQTLNP